MLHRTEFISSSVFNKLSFSKKTELIKKLKSDLFLRLKDEIGTKEHKNLHEKYVLENAIFEAIFSKDLDHLRDLGVQEQSNLDFF